jgi:hypothetical protein
MTPARAAELENDMDAWLTAEELADGWHFCPDWDGMLVNFKDTEGEGSACLCRSLPKRTSIGD